MCKFSLALVVLIFSSVSKGLEMRTTSYDESHMKIVESGFNKFKDHFAKSSDEDKNSLLFCLERYVDPYFEATVDYESELYDWLFELLGSDEPIRVKEHALDVLTWDESRNMSACEINSDGALDCTDEEQ